MSLWLINLVGILVPSCIAYLCASCTDRTKLVAVITSSFQVIREESKASAFTMDGE